MTCNSRRALPFLMSAALVAAAAIPQAAMAQAATADAATPVVAIVRVPKPWYAPRALVESRMRDTMPQYAHVSGLQFKAYSFERASGDYGGIYQWRDRASAQAWYNEAWHQRVRQERGDDASVTLFDAVATIDNSLGGAAEDTRSAAVATVVQWPWPAGTNREQVVAALQAAVPAFRAVPGLLRKHFIVSDEAGTFGGVYLWQDEASARAFITPEWQATMRSRYGSDAAVQWYDTPILLPIR
jgi:Putative mono-oxygenase ydhR